MCLLVVCNLYCVQCEVSHSQYKLSSLSVICCNQQFPLGKKKKKKEKKKKAPHPHPENKNQTQNDPN